MEYLNISFRLLAISQTLLFSCFVLFSQNPKRIKLVTAGLMLGCASYLGMPLIESYTPYDDELAIFWFFSAIVPSMLLIFTYFTFEESCQLPMWVWGLISISVGSSLWFHFIDLGLPGSPLWLHMLKALLALCSIWVVWRGRDNDLVEIRAKLRGVFVVVLAAQSFIIISVAVVTHFDPPLLVDALIHAWVFLFTLMVNFFFVKLNPNAKLMRKSMVVPAKIEDTEDPLVTELLTRMTSERLYADHDLRVGSLAQVLNVPEYKLRQKINQELGFRNFNQFVNHYRIEEAGRKLRLDSRLPVLTIAIEVGFRSISSFNTAFQAQYGVSPTQFRNGDG